MRPSVGDLLNPLSCFIHMTYTVAPSSSSSDSTVPSFSKADFFSSPSLILPFVSSSFFPRRRKRRREEGGGEGGWRQKNWPWSRTNLGGRRRDGRKGLEEFRPPPPLPNSLPPPLAAGDCVPGGERREGYTMEEIRPICEERRERTRSGYLGPPRRPNYCTVQRLFLGMASHLTFSPLRPL